jgi:hypothetical protein
MDVADTNFRKRLLRFEGTERTIVDEIASPSATSRMKRHNIRTIDEAINR